MRCSISWPSVRPCNQRYVSTLLPFNTTKEVSKLYCLTALCTLSNKAQPACSAWAKVENTTNTMALHTPENRIIAARFVQARCLLQLYGLPAAPAPSPVLADGVH